jgi:3-isopropylmalate dehydrogenase
MRILVLPGDGIGPEITEATLKVLKAADRAQGLGLAFETCEIGLASLAKIGTTLSDEVLAKIPQADGVILGPVSHYEYPPKDQGGFNPSAELRVRFQLYANVRPCRSMPDLTVLKTPMDLVLVRENTEGFYADRNMVAGSGEFMPDENLALAVRKISAEGSRRVARAAFEIAARRRRKVTAVHKANVLKLSDGLFLREVRAVARDFPDIELEELIVDAATAHLIRRPESFDVIVTTNMFGDILSDEASELCGSLGLGGSINAGDEVCAAQAQHGSAPDIAGQGIANPTSLIRSAAMLLDWRGRRDGDEKLRAAAARIEQAVDAALADPAARTRDLGGRASTQAFAARVCALIEDPTAAAPRTRQPVVLRPSEVTPRERGGGVRTYPLVSALTGSTQTLSGVTEIEPGAAVPLHFHNCDETVVVLEGEAQAEIAGEPQPVGPGETTWIPAGVHHRFRNPSTTARLRIFWTYASLDADRTLVESGRTSRIDEELGLTAA